MTAEGKLKEKIASFLKERGIFFRRVAQGPRTSIGFPDFMGVARHLSDEGYYGQAFFIEAKAPGRYLNCWEGCKRDSPLQYNFLMEAKKAGAVVYCIDSLDELLDDLTFYVSR